VAFRQKGLVRANCSEVLGRVVRTSRDTGRGDELIAADFIRDRDIRVV
jgi:hypothetical protein